MSLEVQMMIRNQANETRDALSTVVTWETEIERRDQELISLAQKGKYGYEQPKNTNRPNAPPKVTKTQPKKVEIESDNKEQNAEKETKNVSSNRSSVPRTYDQWASLDAKLKRMEAEEKDDDDNDNKKMTPEDHKNMGNKYFKEKKYRQAITEFTKAIELDPSNAVYFYNRATVHYSLANYKECEKDSTEALRLDPRYIKAYFRRALARYDLGKGMSAIEDLEAAQNINPDLKEINDKLAEFRKSQGISADGKIKLVSEPKVKIIEEGKPSYNSQQEEYSGPKVQLIEDDDNNEAEPQPGKIQVVSEEKNHEPAKVSIVTEDEKPKPSKVSIVAEDDKPKPSKVSIVTEEEKPKPSKVSVVTEEEKPKPSKVDIFTEDEKPKPTKVDIVTEDKMSTQKETSANQDKTTKDEANKKALEEGLSLLNNDPVMQETPQKKEAPPQKQPELAKPKSGKIYRAWIDMFPEDFPERLSEMEPSELAMSIGNDCDGSVIKNIVKALSNFTPERKFSYLKAVANLSDFSILKFDPEVQGIKSTVKEMLDGLPSDLIDADDLSKCKKTWGVAK